MRHLFIAVCIVLMTGCENALDASDYVGGYAISSGSCQKTGKLGIDLENNQLSFGFYCFLKQCASISGPINKNQYFHIETSDGYFIQGKLNTKEGNGNWFLEVNGRDCYGQWAALKN